MQEDVYSVKNNEWFEYHFRERFAERIPIDGGRSLS